MQLAVVTDVRIAIPRFDLDAVARLSLRNRLNNLLDMTGPTGNPLDENTVSRDLRFTGCILAEPVCEQLELGKDDFLQGLVKCWR